jgi:arsenate reductase (glutaredoxin)
MADLTVFHNPKCSTSNHAMSALEQAGVQADVVQYLKAPPDRATLEGVIAKLEDPVADLVRKDKRFGELGLAADDYVDDASVVELLLEHPELMQRPVLVKGDRAIIGRPKERVPEFLRS